MPLDALAVQPPVNQKAAVGPTVQ